MILLDTHTLIWVFDSNRALSEDARAAIANSQNTVFVSAVTAWEIAIKRAIGKLRLQGDYQQGLRQYRFLLYAASYQHKTRAGR